MWVVLDYILLLKRIVSVTRPMCYNALFKARAAES